MNVKLGEIAQIQFGLYRKPVEDGNTLYLQAKHFDDLGNQTEKLETYIQVEDKNESHLLRDGDIIIAGKGLRNFAWTYHDKYGPAAASSLFFVLKVDRTRVIPEYLTTLFNMPQTQAYFHTLGAGSSIPSIRKSELEAFPIKLPPLELQQKAVDIKTLHYKELELSKKIIAEKQKAYQAIIKNIINQSYE